MTKYPSDRRVALDAAVALHSQQYAIQVHRGELDGADADVLATASTIFGWLTRPAEHDPVLIALTTRIASLEDRMSKTDEMIAQINTKTNALAERVRVAMEGADADTAAKLAPIATALDGIAADPNNPVPDPEPV
jgi:hypothetical protein